MSPFIQRVLFGGSMLAAIAVGWGMFEYAGQLIPARTRRQDLPLVSVKNFTDGNGIYYYTGGKYNLLYWKKKLFAPGLAPDEKDIAEAAQSAIPVKKDVRFFSYGLDFSKWPVVPPYFMAFCVVRDPHTVEGAFAIRIKLLERTAPVYELQPPDLIQSLNSSVLWAINYMYSCTDGWVFKFQ